MPPHHIAFFALLSSSLACGAKSTPLPDENTGGTAGSSSSGGIDSAGGTGAIAITPREPARHRAEREACDEQRPAYNDGELILDGQEDAGRPEWIECQFDSECTDGARGRCQGFRGDHRCTYDLCQQDSECSLGGPCGCEQSFWSEANSCLAGNCQVDSDCGNNGYCSPTVNDCGNYSGAFSGYYCHTSEDECVDDADCTVDANSGPGSCRYSSDVGHWRCGYGSCVG